MNTNGFGHRLRQARMRKGLDFNTVARRLRIRPDVLKAIEEENFSNIPPRGYARNMINSYARFLGLNASDITMDYLKALSDYEHMKAAKNARQSGFDMEPSSGRFTTARSEYEKRTGEPYVRHDSSSRYMSERSRNKLGHETDNINGLGRRVYTEDSYSPERDTLHSQRTTAAANRAHRQRADRISSRQQPQSESFLNVYGDNYGHNSLMQYLPVIGAAAAVIVLCVAIGSMVIGGGSSEEVTEVPSKTVEQEILSRAQQSAPSSFTVSYEVADGSEVWLEVAVDGETKISDVVSGPATESYTCGEKVSITCGSTEGLTVKVDGQEVSFTKDKKGNLVYSNTLAKILDEWVAMHTTSSESSSSSTAPESSSSSSDDSSSSSDSAESSSSSVSE